VSENNNKREVNNDINFNYESYNNKEKFCNIK